MHRGHFFSAAHKDNFSKDSKEDIGDITAESTWICAMRRKMDVAESRKKLLSKKSLFSDYVIKIKLLVREIHYQGAISQGEFKSF